MTQSEINEARQLLHELWGRHASQFYEKSTDKVKWARLDTLLSAEVMPWRCDDCGLEGPIALLRKGDHHGGTKQVCTDRAACHERSPG